MIPFPAKHTAFVLVIGATVLGTSGSERRWPNPSEREAAVQDLVYTLGVWRVERSKQAEFIAAWRELGQVFGALPRAPGDGTLVQSTSDPELFYSFGPWDRLEDVEEMRSDPAAQAAIERLVALCMEATPGTFRVVAVAPASSGELP